jgi:5-methyltetrahydropteroyltriglutamate--homocysteine methyltransferase
LIPVYIDVLRRLAANGAEWVQLDEHPASCSISMMRLGTRFARPTRPFAHALPKLKIMLATYFGGLGDNLDTALSFPVAGLHIDLVCAPGQVDNVLAWAPQGLVLSLGVIDGRNIWRANLPALLDRLEPIVAKRGTDHVQIAPSYSLLHVPIDLHGDRSSS